jgi:two-component system OmpR family sensor kinase
MRSVPAKSIRRYLLISLIFALTVGSFLVVIFTYTTAADEIDELYDKNMMGIAETLKSQINALDFDSRHIKSTVGSSLEGTIEEEQEFLVQIWDKNGLPIYTSHRAIPYPFQEKRGANITEFADELWRTYGTETNGFIIQISQPQKARDYYIREISFHLLYPLLFVIPVVGFFLWLAIGRSLVPLIDISTAITKRSASRLEPLSENTPIEIQPLVQELNELLARLNNSLQTQRNFIAEQHGGTIAVGSGIEGKGAGFTVTLPLSDKG